MTIRLTITRTWKSYAPNASWETYDFEARMFETLKDAKQWAKENLPRGSRRPIYQDTASRGTIKCGYIVGFRLNDYDRRGRKLKHLEQWWIAFEEVLHHPTEGKAGEVRSIAL